jgi:hypothetical protein
VAPEYGGRASLQWNWELEYSETVCGRVIEWLSVAADIFSGNDMPFFIFLELSWALEWTVFGEINCLHRKHDVYPQMTERPESWNE